MREKTIVVTNNILSEASLRGRFEVIFLDGTIMDVLLRVRDLIHMGHRLLTHPLMGSIKPNQTPYKTVAVSYAAEKNVDMESLMIIENSIETTERLIRNRKPSENLPETVLEDFRLIDFDLINNAL